MPVLGSFISAAGGIRVDRAEGGAVSYDMAALALEGGEMVGLLPEGTIPRGEAFFDPVLKGKTGAARLAAASRAPVIPVGMWGTEKVWPRSSKAPNLLNLSNPPTVRIRVGPPVDLLYRSAAADTKRIMAAVSDLLPPEAREQRTPSEDEPARDLPRRSPPRRGLTPPLAPTRTGALRPALWWLCRRGAGRGVYAVPAPRISTVTVDLARCPQAA